MGHMARNKPSCCMVSSGLISAIMLLTVTAVAGAELSSPMLSSPFAEQAAKMKEIRELFIKHESDVTKTNNDFQDRLSKLKTDMSFRLGRSMTGTGVAGMAGAMAGLKTPKRLPPFTAGLNELGIGIA